MGLVTFECHTEGCQNCGLIVVPKAKEPKVGSRVFLHGDREPVWTVTRHAMECDVGEVFWAVTDSCGDREFYTHIDSRWEYVDERP